MKNAQYRNKLPVAPQHQQLTLGGGENHFQVITAWRKAQTPFLQILGRKARNWECHFPGRNTEKELKTECQGFLLAIMLLTNCSKKKQITANSISCVKLTRSCRGSAKQEKKERGDGWFFPLCMQFIVCLNRNDKLTLNSLGESCRVK